jgi:hypothetical protein
MDAQVFFDGRHEWTQDDPRQKIKIEDRGEKQGDAQFVPQGGSFVIHQRIYAGSPRRLEKPVEGCERQTEGFRDGPVRDFACMDIHTHGQGMIFLGGNVQPPVGQLDDIG